MNNRNIIVGAIVAVLVGFALGYVVFHQNQLAGAVSSSGAYLNAPGLSATIFAPTTANGTSTSILNSGASDRAITGITAYCSGAGAAQNFLVGNTSPTIISNGWTLLVATTSVASQGLQGSTNYIMNSFIGTTSPLGNYMLSSTTEGVIQYVNRIWPINTYLTFNLNATNTAVCTYGASWVPL